MSISTAQVSRSVRLSGDRQVDDSVEGQNSNRQSESQREWCSSELEIEPELRRLVSLKHPLVELASQALD